MSVSDPIADMLTTIRNAVNTKKETVDVPASRLTEQILSIFKNHGYIEDFRLMKPHAQGSFKVYLKYLGKNPAILGLRRVSRPGLKVYVNRHEIPRVINGLGLAVISTSRGVITDHEARKIKVGGEVICQVW